MLFTAILTLAMQPSPTANTDVPQGTLAFNVTNSEGQHIPARLTFTGVDGSKSELFPNPDASPESLAVREHAVYTLDGKGSITVPVGEWNILASHGIEWSIDQTKINIEEGGEYSWDAKLVHEIDTTRLGEWRFSPAHFDI